MYKKYKGVLNIRTPVYNLRNYLTEGLEKEKRELFVKDLLIKQLYNCKNKKVGFFIGLKSYSIWAIKVSPYDNNILDITCSFEAYFCKIDQNEIVLAKVKEITPAAILLYLHNPNLIIQVPLSQVSSEPVQYRQSGVNETGSLLLKNNVRIKENDLLKIKILAFTGAPTGNLGLKYRINATCAVRGLGKIDRNE